MPYQPNTRKYPGRSRPPASRGAIALGRYGHSLRSWSELNGLSRQHLSHVLLGRRRLTAQMVDSLRSLGGPKLVREVKAAIEEELADAG
jgi:hypothetical protein